MQWTIYVTLAVAAIFLQPLATHARSGGAPTDACINLTPNHNMIGAANDAPGGYFIYTSLRDIDFNYNASTEYTITLYGMVMFRGFVIQARNAADSTTLIGSFGNLDAGTTRLLNGCGGDSTVTHSNANDKRGVTVTWTSPPTSGVVEIRYSVVRQFTTFYANLNAADFTPSCGPPPAVTASPETFYPIVFGFPVGCRRTNCDYFVAMGPNPLNDSYLDIHLEANALGYVAVGFSVDMRMNGTDVLGCRVVGGMTEVIDTWNPVSRSNLTNIPDATQDDICPLFAQFENGRIVCRFNRLTAITDVNYDNDLDDDYFLIFARRLEAQPPGALGFGAHSPAPMVSQVMLNPTMDNFTNLDPTAIICPPRPDPMTVYNVTFGTPGSDYFFGARVNPTDNNFLDMRLEANAEGWVAVGFSRSQSMELSDVLGCKRDDAGDMVTVLDTWNPPNPPAGGRTANILDEDQNGLCQHDAQFINGRITCTFSRLIAAQSARDLSLNEPLFQLYGTSMNRGPNNTALGIHMPNTPMISTGQIIAADIGNIICPPRPDPMTAYDFTFGTPGSGYFFGARVNPTDNNFLDMRLEANAEGWVAVGFSRSSSMELSDVLGCKRDDAGDMVTVLDTWNPNLAERGRTNILDENQDGLCQHDAQFMNGRITCTFSRLIIAQSDLDLSLNESLFQLYGTSMNRGPGNTALAVHMPNTPMISTGPIIATNEGSSNAFPTRDLLKAHGILMIISWPVLVVVAIFFASWMKPALPNGEWFQFHRAFMITAVALTLIGFILAFVSQAPNRGLISPFAATNGVHFVFGILVVLLQLANPIIALFRCKPTDSKRWIFNISHATLIGFGAELLALTNVGIGIALFERGQYSILWVYIGFVIFLLTLQVVLFILFTIVALNTDDPKVRKGLAPSLLKYVLADPIEKTENIEMTSQGAAKTEKSDKPVRKDPSKDAPLRWVAMGVFIIVTLILMLTIVILVAIR